MKDYYEARAREYDEWYEGTGLFATRERPGWAAEVRELERLVAALPARRTLDVACGTGYLTRHLRGEVTALDQSAQMLDVARRRLPAARLVQGDALALPFPDGAFERVMTGHFLGHLEGGDRDRFLAEAFRVASELVVIDSAVRPDHEQTERQTRTLNDGSTYTVFKRYFDAGELAEELGGGEVLHAGDWFVVVAAPAAT